jgi:hypothetical protein
LNLQQIVWAMLQCRSLCSQCHHRLSIYLGIPPPRKHQTFSPQTQHPFPTTLQHQETKHLDMFPYGGRDALMKESELGVVFVSVFIFPIVVLVLSCLRSGTRHRRQQQHAAAALALIPLPTLTTSRRRYRGQRRSTRRCW